MLPAYYKSFSGYLWYLFVGRDFRRRLHAHTSCSEIVRPSTSKRRELQQALHHSLPSFGTPQFQRHWYLSFSSESASALNDVLVEHAAAHVGLRPLLPPGILQKYSVQIMAVHGFSEPSRRLFEWSILGGLLREFLQQNACTWGTRI